MVEHLKLSEKTDPNKLGILNETVLPYVNNNIKNVNGRIQRIKFVFKKLTTDIKVILDLWRC